MSYDEMYHSYQKRKAESEIRNLISNYCFEHNCGLQMRYFHQWSKREDIRHEMPWGNTTGHANLEYNNPWSDVIRHPDDSMIMRGGALFIHMTTTPVIEVADDLQTARCVFLSPGFEGIARDRDGTWAYSKYAFEMLFEDGHWTVWHARIYPVFRNEFEADFGKVAEEDLTAGGGERFDDFHNFFRYGPNVIVPADEPEPPLPYHSWAPDWVFKTDEENGGYE
jgi:hypothetical protein